STHPARKDEDPSAETLRQIDALCDRCEKAWEAWKANPRAHPQPRIENYLSQTPDSWRDRLLRELRAIEAHFKPEWYYTKDRKQKLGPFTFNKLKGLATAGDVQPTDGVRREDAQEWREAARVPGLCTIGHHEIQGILGQGGMGIVYKAWHTKLKRLVALKMVLGDNRVPAPALARFHIEPEALARLQHPNIVQVFEVGEHRGQPYFSLEFVAGGSLEKKLDGTPVPPSQAAQIVETLARAMDYAHQQRIVHRDLKPANVLVSGQAATPVEQSTLKITDFGLAKQLDTDGGRTQTGAILGTPSYMAPEQAEGRIKEIAPVTDVYALGAILYELLTGQPPFKGTDWRDTLNQVCHDEPVSPRRLRPKVPRDLETICLKCIEKLPSKRYVSALDLAEDLRRFLGAEPIRARPPRVWERAWKWARRRPAVAAVSVVLIGLVVTLVWYSVETSRLVRELSEQNRQTVAAKTLAETNEKTAEQRKVEADRARQLAEKEAKENLQRSIRMTLATSRQLMGEGDLFGALLYAAEALTKDDPNSPQVKLHRLRMAAGLQQAPKLLQVWSHAEAVTCVAFHPDGSKVLTASLDGTARVWDTNTGEPATPQALVHDGPVGFAAFSPDGRRIVTGGDDNTVRLWDAQSGKLLREPFKLEHPAFQVAFKPGDGKYVLAVSGNRYAGAFWRSGRPITLATPGTWVPGPPILVPGPPIVTMKRVGNILVPEHMPGPMRTIPGPMRYLPGTTQTLPGILQQVQPYGDVHMWDVETGQPIGPPIRQKGWINFAAFNPDGTRVVTAGGSLEGERAAYIWDVSKREMVGPESQTKLRHSFDVHWAVFSPDGRRLLTASGPLDGTRGEAQVWDVATEQPLGRSMKHGGPVIQAVFSPGGRQVLTASTDETARVWNAELGEPVTPPLQQRDRLAGAWFSPDGRRVLTASWDGTARIWAVTTGELLQPPLRNASRLTTASFSPDGRRVLTASRDGLVRLWDLAADLHRPAVLKHSAVVQPPGLRRTLWTKEQRTVRSKEYLGGVVATSAVFSQDGHFVVSGAGSRVVDLIQGGARASVATEIETHHLCVWEAAGGKLVLPPLSHQNLVTATTLSADGRRVLTVSQDGVRLWELPAGKPLAHRPLETGALFRCAAFGSDDRCAMVTVAPAKTAPNQKTPSGWVVQVRDVLSNDPVVPPLEYEAQVEQAALSAQGSKLVTVALEKSSQGNKDLAFEWVARVWDLKNKGQPAGRPLRHRSLITQVAVSPDGEQILTYRPSLSGAPLAAVEASDSQQEEEAHLWDVRTGQQFLLKHAGAVTHAAFSPDGRYAVTASGDRTARVWDLQGRPVSPPLEHRARVNHAAFGGEGLVVTASNDHTARVWDALTGEPVSPPLRHKHAVLHAAFSANGSRLVTSDLAGTARVWELSADGHGDEERKELAQLLACYRIDSSGGLTALDRKTLPLTWEKLRQRSPGDFTASPRQVFAWHNQEAEEAEQASDWRAALLHLDQMIAANPADWQPRARHGHAHAYVGKWEEAAVDYARAIEQGGDNESLWNALALIHLKQGRTDDYRHTCADLLRRFGQTKDMAVARTVGRTCLLAPDALEDPNILVQLAERFAAGKEANAAALGMLGAAFYRAGRFKDAEQKLPSAGGAASDWLFLAMVHHHLGHAEEAKKWLDKALQSYIPCMGSRDFA
ncbi:MAG: protein kinase, partial [Gemmataceae bacterium]|nr:protein kinase [Gemmataceae bacterium]